MLVGAQIKKLRTEQRMTIKTLAQKTGLSVGFISNVEHEINSPTISSLQRICEALNTNIASFFSLSASSSIVSRLADSQRLYMPAPMKTTCDLFPLLNRKLNPSYITMDVDGYYGEPPFCHEGEEICVVISGTVEMTAGNEKWILEAGDCVYIESYVPHKMSNVGDEKAKTVWVTLRNR